MARMVLFIVATLAATTSVAGAVGDNLALGRPYTWSSEPRYSLTKDADDAVQLTDGRHAPSGGMMWTHRECVGWPTRSLRDQGVVVTVDLGAVLPISGFAWHYAAGCSGVKHPTSIAVYAGDDGKSWRYAGDLMGHSIAENGAPRDDGSHEAYAAKSMRMPTKGRYVAFVVASSPYVFCDELEVFRGPDSLLGSVGDRHPVLDIVRHAGACAVRNRVMADLERCAPENEALRARVEDLAFGENVLDVTTILPLNDIHREVWGCNAKRLAKAGFAEPVLWTNCRWDNLDPLAIPPDGSVGNKPLTVEMMRNETRATSVNVLNPTAETRMCTVRVEGLPGSVRPDLREVLFTDTKLSSPVASALKAGEGSSVRFAIPGGSSKQVWISFARPKGEAGRFCGRIVATLAGKTLERPIVLTLHERDFPDRPRCHLGGWDYAMTDGSYFKAPGNDAANLALLKEMYVDTYMAQGRILPSGAKFDAAGCLTNPEAIDYSGFDTWVRRIPWARLYNIHVNVVRWRFPDGDRAFMFEGERIGTSRFNRMVGDYCRAWRGHLRRIGIAPDRVLLHLVDEPSLWRTEILKAEIPPVIAAWSRAIKTAVPEFVIWENPDYEVDMSVGGDDLYGSSDVVVPQLCWVGDPGHANNLRFFRRLVEAGKPLWFYSVCMPSRLSDPEAYFRQSFWLAYQWGALGNCYWAFGCGGGIGDSFHAYLQTSPEYSPYFVTPDSVMPSKHSEAIREGVEDYEYLALLAEMIARAKAAGVDTARAEAVLGQAPARALHQTGEGTRAKYARGDDLRWCAPKDRTSCDKAARAVLRVMAELDLEMRR